MRGYAATVEMVYQKTDDFETQKKTDFETPPKKKRLVEQASSPPGASSALLLCACFDFTFSARVFSCLSPIPYAFLLLYAFLGGQFWQRVPPVLPRVPDEPRPIFHRAANAHALARSRQSRLSGTRRDEATQEGERVGGVAPRSHQT